MKITAYIFAAIMIFSAVMHVIQGEFYEPMIPNWISVDLANYGTAVLEALVGVLLILPAQRRMGGLGFMLLMIGFLPIHIWDLFRPDPVMGSMTKAVIRLVIQFGLIYLGWKLYKKA